MGRYNAGLGPQFTYNADEGTAVHFNAAASGQNSSSLNAHHGGSTAPAPTLVTNGGNLEFNLIWDSSVSNLGSNQTAFMNAMINAASYYETLFTTPHPEVINIKVGWGEINGQNLPAGALGSSESNGYLTNYTTVTNGLIASSGGAVTAASFKAANEPINSQFFITSAEAKGFGLISPTSTGVDGYVGFGTLSGTGYSWNFASSATTGQGSGTGPLQFDFQGVAQHEISEVMGRIEMEGHSTFNGQATYTPLDLFNFDSVGHLALSAGYNTSTQVSSYFSLDSGTSVEGYFNDAYKSGDIADWASYSSYNQSQTGLSSGYQDAFDAFGYPSINTDLSYDDQLVMETLGVSSTGVFII